MISVSIENPNHKGTRRITKENTSFQQPSCYFVYFVATIHPLHTSVLQSDRLRLHAARDTAPPEPQSCPAIPQRRSLTSTWAAGQRRNPAWAADSPVRKIHMRTRARLPH